MIVDNKPYRHSVRLKTWDYSSSGYYFVTLCTFQKRNLFGDIVNDPIVGAIHESPVHELPAHKSYPLSQRNMVLNDRGLIIRDVWQSLSDRFPVDLDQYQIMPNHVHGIIIINRNGVNGNTNHRAHRDAPLRMDKRSLLSQIIGYVKMNTTKQIHALTDWGFPVWQRNYYEHIIRNEAELEQTRKYIQNNPQNWEQDEEFLL